MQYAKVSSHGYSQEVRIPKTLRFNTDRVKITKYGKGLLIEPAPKGFEGILEAIGMFSDDFISQKRGNLPNQQRDEIFR
jgi:virulence-associated protein VagC